MVITLKYAVVLCDGMADYPVAELGGKTPMMAANKPAMDGLAAHARVGLVKTVDDSLSPGSDVANLSVMGYDPKIYYSGRSPLEAVSMGIDLAEDDVTVRCNLVTLSQDEPFESKTMLDYCAGDISTREAALLVEALEQELGDAEFSFYAGVSYRHCLVWKHGELNLGTLVPPHDIPGQSVGANLPALPVAAPLCRLMKKAFPILNGHPVNIARRKAGKKPANGIWLWGQGFRPRIDPFFEKFGIHGSVVSAVDLIKGIGLCAQMSVCQIAGATGYIDTNFENKTRAALNELARGQDFVYIHLEAPDECGHRHEVENKVRSIELIDSRVLAPLLKGMEQFDEYRILVLPDHPTPLCTRTHARDAVPFLLYDSARPVNGVSCFHEESAKATGLYVDRGCNLMELLLGRE